MPVFVDDMLQWAFFSGRHFMVMLWWMWVLAVVATVVSESFLFDKVRRRVLEAGDDSWPTILTATLLGILSPPSRSRIFRQAKELLAHGVSPGVVTAYLVSAQMLFLWMLFFIVELDGPQPAIGLFVAIGAALAVLLYGVRRMPEELWQSVRQSAERGAASNPRPTPIARQGPVARRILLSLGGQAYSLWWPLLFGLIGIGFFMALGQSPAYFTLQGTRDPWVQLGNAVAGLLLAYVSGAPLVGNALLAAGLWKASFISYAGLAAFYLGTLVMPFALPRYVDLFGIDVSKRLLGWMVAAILISALVATAWWWGLDWFAGVVGVRDLFESLSHSTLRPNDVPWFHHWFQSMPGM